MRPLLADLVRSEWTKLWSVRSTYWALLAIAAALISLAAAFAATGPAAPADPAAYGLSGFFQAQLGAAAVGVLAITPEYATGSIHATFTAAPAHRGPGRQDPHRRRHRRRGRARVRTR